MRRPLLRIEDAEIIYDADGLGSPWVALSNLILKINDIKYQ
jgi:hypothetical protein